MSSPKASADKIVEWAGQIRAGEVRAISRAISVVEDHGPQSEPLLQAIFPFTGQSFLIGVTGAPGTGKSTLVNRLASHYRQSGDAVGIIAVDPTSPYTGGAILGDRIRMQSHAGDAGIFIRSMATRGFLGGLARATGDVALVLEAAGKRQVLIETVGVGQDEVDIVRLADCTLVLLVPGFGDDVQNMKAGVMEIADIFVVNKSDREGADRLEQQIGAMLELVPERDGWKPRIIRTVATEDGGLAELCAAIRDFRNQFAHGAARKAKLQDRWKRRLLALAQEQFLERIAGNPAGEESLEQLARAVSERKTDPYSAVRELLARAEARPE